MFLSGGISASRDAWLLALEYSSLFNASEMMLVPTFLLNDRKAEPQCRVYELWSVGAAITFADSPLVRIQSSIPDLSLRDHVNRTCNLLPLGDKYLNSGDVLCAPMCRMVKGATN